MKSDRWRVYDITNSRYQVNNRKHDFLVNLATRECACLKWQHSGLPCGHVMAVLKHLGITDCLDKAKHWFTILTYKETYAEAVDFVGDVSNWLIPKGIQQVLPPLNEQT